MTICHAIPSCSIVCATSASLRSQQPSASQQQKDQLASQPADPQRMVHRPPSEEEEDGGTVLQGVNHQASYLSPVPRFQFESVAAVPIEGPCGRTAVVVVAYYDPVHLAGVVGGL